jgi:transposase InsO family protein
VQQQLCQVFECWGQPGSIRVDNGAPFGSPTGYAPPPLSLWLIGQGVNMIWNKPYRPTQNAKVEKLQVTDSPQDPLGLGHTTSRWAEVSKARTTEELQQRLERIVTMQRERYPVRRLEGKTRLQAFPALLSGKRPYRPADFQRERVWAFFH